MRCINTGILGVNTWIVPICANAVLVVDPGASRETGDAFTFVDFFKKNALAPIGVFLTHGHFDHIAGTGIFKEDFPFAPVSIHQNDLGMVGKSALYTQGPLFVDMGIPQFARILQNLPEPDVLFQDGQNLCDVFDSDVLSQSRDFSSLFTGSFSDLKDGLKKWKIISTPGHTEGSVCLYCEEKKSLVSGDTVFFHSYGRTDLPGGSDIEMQKSLALLQKIVPKDVNVYPGHGDGAFLFGENAGVLSGTSF